MTKQEKELLKQLDSTYNQKRLDEMARLNNKLAAIITKAHLPSQDVAMVLTSLQRQVEGIFLNSLYPKQEKNSGSNMEKDSV